MLPLSDGLPARRFPVVNVLLIVANFAVWLFYELPHLNVAVFHASFYPCAVDNACRRRRLRARRALGRAAVRVGGRVTERRRYAAVSRRRRSPGSGSGRWQIS